MASLNLAVIPGDGTGPEVVAEGLKVLAEVARKEGFAYDVTELDYGGERYLKTGQVISDDEVQALRRFDAVYLGAIGHPEVRPGILEKGLLLKLRFDLDQYINLRPVKLFPGVDCPLKDKGPADVDFVVVRENTEDLYSGAGGFLRKGTPQEVATQEMIATRFGADRCLRYAFRLAERRRAAGKPGRLTLVGKTNVLTYASDLWLRAFEEMGQREFPEVQRDYNHVDAVCMWLVKNPEYYDTVVVPNMFGDIITDLAAMIQGGLGVAAGGNINPDPGGVSMFEPMGGSAPKYTGQKAINPIAAVAAMGMLLSVTGELRGDEALQRAGRRVEGAIAATCPKMTSQNAGQLGHTTDQVGDLVCAAL
jgi:3-isopropylmalate dehydrogenase